MVQIIQLTANKSSNASGTTGMTSAGSTIWFVLGFGAPYPKQNLHQGAKKVAKLTSDGNSHTIAVVLTWEFL